MEINSTAWIAVVAPESLFAVTRWAELMRRRLGLDVLACPRRDGRLTLIALIDDPAVIRRLLRHLELPTEVREARPARAPPVPRLDSAPPTGGALDEVFVDDSA